MKTNVHGPTTPHEAGQMVQNAAMNTWTLMLARLGYVMKGVVYLVIGVLAVQLAVGRGGKATDQRGAIQTIADFPFGKVLLVVVIIGLVGFALWCFLQAIFDTEGKGREAKGILARIGYAFVGISYAGLALGAYHVVTNTGTVGKNSTTQTQDWTALLLQLPFGVALLVLVGLGVLGLAGYLFYKAYAATFQRRLTFSGVGARIKRWLVSLGRCGYAALGIVFAIVGLFLIVAAFQHDATKAKGLDAALLEIARQPLGSVLLIIVALGLIAYGLYSFVEARYRRVGRG